MPKISVIVPVYKVEAYINRCIDSILGQSFSDFELILVDDGSPDNCGKICDEYSEKDSRIHVIHQENRGVSAARNVGIEWALAHSNSQWIAFIDSDDWIHRDYLRILYTMAEENQSQIAICDCIWTSETCEDAQIDTWETVCMEPEQTFVRYYTQCMPPWEKLIHKTLLTDLRFPVGMRYEDAYISHIVTLSANKICICPEKLYYYDNPESYTRVKWTKERLVVVDVHEKRLDFLREHKYQKAYCRELEEYAERITSNLYSLTDIIDDNEEYREIFEDLRIKLKEAVRKAEELDVFHLDRERLMTYAYICPGNIVWRIARMMQRIWRKIHKH